MQLERARVEASTSLIGLRNRFDIRDTGENSFLPVREYLVVEFSTYKWLSSYQPVEGYFISTAGKPCSSFISSSDIVVFGFSATGVSLEALAVGTRNLTLSSHTYLLPSLLHRRNCIRSLINLHDLAQVFPGPSISCRV